MIRAFKRGRAGRNFSEGVALEFCLGFEGKSAGALLVLQNYDEQSAQNIEPAATISYLI